jgi:hypothetical protein
MELPKAFSVKRFEQVINFERIDQSQSGVSRARETKKPFEKGL